VAYHLGSLGLTVTTTVTNRDGVPLPFGVAFTLPRGDDSNHRRRTVGDSGEVLHRGGRPTIADRRDLAAGGNPLDFSTRKSVSGHDIDMTYTDLIRDDSGLAVATIEDSHGDWLN